MIKTYKELQFCITADDIMNEQVYPTGLFSRIFCPCYIKSYLHSLRWLDYLRSNRHWYNLPLYLYYRVRFHRLGYRLGFEIPPESLGYGCRISHFGSLTLNPSSRIGNYCCLHNLVTFAGGEPKRIGNRCFISTGCVIAKEVYIADDCTISANSLVNRSFEKCKTLLGGVTAKELATDKPSWLSEGLYNEEWKRCEQLRLDMGLPENIIFDRKDSYK